MPATIPQWKELPEVSGFEDAWHLYQVLQVLGDRYGAKRVATMARNLAHLAGEGE